MTDRRDFLKTLAAATAALLPVPDPTTSKDRLGALLPVRKFGRTGIDVTMLGVGGAHIGRESEKTAKAIIETALEGGVRFFDNAEMYSRGRAETYYGKLLTPKYRDVAYIMTKTTASNADQARRHLEGSLRRMNTDYIDLWQMHQIASPADVDDRIQRGVLDVVLKAQEEGKVRHIGFTGHRDFNAHLQMLDATDVQQACQMPVNCFDPNYKSFILNVMPQLVDRGLGIVAMKTLANGGFFGGTSHFNHGSQPRIVPDVAGIREALHFTWSLPVSVVVTGASTPDMLTEKIEMAKSFTGMSEEDRTELIARVANFDGRKVEYYKA